MLPPNQFMYSWRIFSFLLFCFGGVFLVFGGNFDVLGVFLVFVLCFIVVYIFCTHSEPLEMLLFNKMVS